MKPNAAFMPEQCRKRKKNPYKHRFTPEEDEKLRQLVELYGVDDWAKIASMMNRKNERQVRDRWVLSLDPAINREPFSESEDELLLKLYDSIGPKWVNMKKFFDRRTDVALKTRYLSLLRKIENGGKSRRTCKKKVVEAKPPVEIENTIPLIETKETNGEKIFEDLFHFIDEFFIGNYKQTADLDYTFSDF